MDYNMVLCTLCNEFGYFPRENFYSHYYYHSIADIMLHVWIIYATSVGRVYTTKYSIILSMHVRVHYFFMRFIV